MTSTQRLTHNIRDKLNENNRKQALFKDRSLIGFLSTPCSRTSYNARIYWLLYRINLVTLVPFEFQQKTNLALNNRLDPKISLTFSAPTQYDKWYLNFLVSGFFVLGIYSNMENPIVSNKYKN